MYATTANGRPLRDISDNQAERAKAEDFFSSGSIGERCPNRKPTWVTAASARSEGRSDFVLCPPRRLVASVRPESLSKSASATPPATDSGPTGRATGAIDEKDLTISQLKESLEQRDRWLKDWQRKAESYKRKFKAANDSSRSTAAAPLTTAANKRTAEATATLRPDTPSAENSSVELADLRAELVCCRGTIGKLEQELESAKRQATEMSEAYERCKRHYKEKHAALSKLKREAENMAVKKKRRIQDSEDESLPLKVFD